LFLLPIFDIDYLFLGAKLLQKVIKNKGFCKFFHLKNYYFYHFDLFLGVFLSFCKLFMCTHTLKLYTLPKDKIFKIQKDIFRILFVAKCCNFAPSQ